MRSKNTQPTHRPWGKWDWRKVAIASFPLKHKDERNSSVPILTFNPVGGAVTREKGVSNKRRVWGLGRGSLQHLAWKVLKPGGEMLSSQEKRFLRGSRCLISLSQQVLFSIIVIVPSTTCQFLNLEEPTWPDLEKVTQSDASVCIWSCGCMTTHIVRFQSWKEAPAYGGPFWSKSVILMNPISKSMNWS